MSCDVLDDAREPLPLASWGAAGDAIARSIAGSELSNPDGCGVRLRGIGDYVAPEAIPGGSQGVVGGRRSKPRTAAAAKIGTVVVYGIDQTIVSRSTRRVAQINRRRGNAHEISTPPIAPRFPV